MSVALDRLTADVALQSVTNTSVLTLLSGLAAIIRSNVDDSSELNALADTLESQGKALADAVVANTPAPTPAPAPAPATNPNPTPTTA